MCVCDRNASPLGHWIHSQRGSSWPPSALVSQPEPPLCLWRRATHTPAAGHARTAAPSPRKTDGHGQRLENAARAEEMPPATAVSRYLLSGAGHQALVQPQGLLLREALRLVVPGQSALDLCSGEAEKRP